MLSINSTTCVCAHYHKNPENSDTSQNSHDIICHSSTATTSSRSVKDDREWLAVNRLSISTVKEVVVTTNECKQEVGDKQDLSCGNDQRYCKVEVGIGAASVDPQIPQHRCHHDTDAVHYC